MRHHLETIRTALAEPVVYPLYSDPSQHGATVSFVPFVPYDETIRHHALVVLLDVSGSMNYLSRLVQARSAIAAIAPRYVSGGVFLLPWNTRPLPMIQIMHANDEDEVTKQLQSLQASGGTVYTAAVLSLVTNFPKILSTFHITDSTEVTVGFITDSTDPNSDTICFDEVISSLRQDIGHYGYGERVVGLKLVGINIAGVIGMQSTFNSFRLTGSDLTNWITIHDSKEIETTMRQQLGVAQVEVSLTFEAVVPDYSGTSLRLSGVDMTELTTGQTWTGQRPASQQLCVVISHEAKVSYRRPTDVRFVMRIQSVETQIRLMARTQVLEDDRPAFIQRLYQTIRTKVLPTFMNDVMSSETGFGQNPAFEQEYLLRAIGELKLEYNQIMREFGITEEDETTRYTFTQWQMMLDQLHQQVRTRHEQQLYLPNIVTNDRERLETAIRSVEEQRSMFGVVVAAVQTEEQDPVQSVYRKRKPKPRFSVASLDAELQRLHSELAETAQRETNLLERGELGGHRYVARRYLGTIGHSDTVIEDMQRFTRTRGECIICGFDDVSLYTLSCCRARVCGSCGVNVKHSCPFCRRINVTFVADRTRRRRADDEYGVYGRYACEANGCIVHAEGQYRSLQDCESKCDRKA